MYKEITNMSTTLTHTLHEAIELRYQEQTLFRYVYESGTPSLESPRPYFHPLKTLAGNEVTIWRPYDHLWHVGLSMAVSSLSGENFWGGPTYMRDIGYVQLDNNGRIQHSNWQEITCAKSVRCIEQLEWITHTGETWINEERQIAVSEINPEGGYWSLDLSFHLVNVAGRPLVFSSPTLEGRPEAGYGSLFWRGPRSFLHGKILASQMREGPDMMGQTSPWLAFSGWHDGNGEQSTMLFIDDPRNPRPTKWFVRNDPYGCVSCSFMFDEEYVLQPGEMVELAYRVVPGCGAWSHERIESYYAHLPI